jgi:hypothetical protein
LQPTASTRQGGRLKKASEYYQHAAECRELARTALTAEHRGMLETMARTWESLAREREERLMRLAQKTANDPAPMDD